MSPTVTKISGATCHWAMTDRDGYAYPHGIKATRRVSDATEFMNGKFCARHATEAIRRSIEEATRNAKN